MPRHKKCRHCKPKKRNSRRKPQQKNRNGHRRALMKNTHKSREGKEWGGCKKVALHQQQKREGEEEKREEEEEESEEEKMEEEEEESEEEEGEESEEEEEEESEEEEEEESEAVDARLRRLCSPQIFGNRFYDSNPLYQLGARCIDAYTSATKACGYDPTDFRSFPKTLTAAIEYANDNSSPLFHHLAGLTAVARAAFTLSPLDIRNLLTWRNTIVECRHPVADIMRIEALHPDLPECARSVGRRAYTVLLVTLCKMAGKSMKTVLHSHIPTTEQAVYLNSLGLGTYSPVAT